MLCRDKMKKVLLQFLILIFMAGVAYPSSPAKVVVIMSADVKAYRDALQGFKSSVRHQIVKVFHMNGDFGRGRKFLTEIEAKIKPDLIFVVGIWALQVVARQTVNIPSVYAMVLNPLNVVGAKAQNITGASMNVPVDLTIRLFKQLGPKIERVGVIFDPAKTVYLVNQAESVAQEQGIQLIAKQVRSPKQAIQALGSLAGKIDALWILPDATVLAPEVVQYMLLFSYRKKIPLLGISERQAQKGAVLSLSFASSNDIGKQAGELSNSILGGKTPAEIPYTTARQVKLTVNLKAARKLEMEIPKSILKIADSIIK